MTEDEMVGWHHRLDRHEFVQTLGDSEGKGSLVCCSLWSHKESDMTDLVTEQQNETTGIVLEVLDNVMYLSYLRFQNPQGNGKASGSNVFKQD